MKTWTIEFTARTQKGLAVELMALSLALLGKEFEAGEYVDFTSGRRCKVEVTNGKSHRGSSKNPR
jgi:hypothetical protein